MICFCTTDAQYTAAKELCILCFGDDPSYMDGVFSRTKKEDLLLFIENETVISMAFLLPFTLGSRTGHYIYCACTHPDHRGKGYMTQLLQAAKEKGSERGDRFSFLLPANDGLFDFYRERGYTVPYYCGYGLEYPSDIPAADLRDATPDEFYHLRRDLMKNTNGLIHGKEASDLAYFDAISSGGRVLTDGVSTAVCYPEKNVFIKELVTTPDRYDNVVSGILQLYGCPLCTVQGQHFEDQYILGLLHWMGEPSTAELYGNLLLD